MFYDIFGLSLSESEDKYENDDIFSPRLTHLNQSFFSEDFQKKLPNCICEIEKNTKSNGAKTNQQKDEPELYTSTDILTIFNKESNKNKISEIFKRLNFRKYIEEDLQLTKIKTRREYDESDNFFLFNKNINLEDNKTKKKRGRSTNKTNK